MGKEMFYAVNYHNPSQVVIAETYEDARAAAEVAFDDAPSVINSTEVFNPEQKVTCYVATYYNNGNNVYVEPEEDEWTVKDRYEMIEKHLWNDVWKVNQHGFGSPRFVARGDTWELAMKLISRGIRYPQDLLDVPEQVKKGKG